MPSKACLETYNPKMIESLKKESRLKSKREWAKRKYKSTKQNETEDFNPQDKG